MRFILIGGFLGAGKTTAIARLADDYRRRGRNVAIVTNDQGSDLVDTQRLRALGNHVGEFTGSCFCGNVDSLLETVDQLGIAARPDVVLLEPIGSCIDLAATVIRPLASQWGERVTVAPYVVLLKPRHGLRILAEQAPLGVSASAVYIFRKQLEEADVLAINRADELSRDEVERLTALVNDHFPGREVLPISAGTGQGFDKVLRAIERPEESGRRQLDVDYSQYAAGEAALGWLNASLLVEGPAFDLDELVFDVVRGAQTAIVRSGGQIAHLKAIGSSAGAVAAVNVIGNDDPPDRSMVAARQARQAELTINARVGIEPERLEACVRAALDATCAARGLNARIVQLQSFRPGGLTPAYRVV